MTDEPETHTAADETPSPLTNEPPIPGDPEYDAFLREVQRLADERQAAQLAARPTSTTPRIEELIVPSVVGAIGLLLVLSVWLGVFGDSATATGAALVGLAGLVIGAVWIVRVVRSDPGGAA